MNLYRLDYERPNGDLTPVYDWPIVNYLTRHWATARRDALSLANADGSVVRITRISGAGQTKVVARASGETGRIHRVKS